MAKSRKPLNEVEKLYIQDHCLDQTDEIIATYLGRDIRTIKTYRNQIGVKKGRGGKIKKVEIFADGESKEVLPNAEYNKVQKKEFYRLQLKNSLYYDILQETLSAKELEYYLEAWADLSQQFSDVVQTEKRQIDELIKAEIAGNRIAADIQVVRKELEEMAKQVDELRANNQDQDDMEMVQERDDYLMSMISRMGSVCQSMSNDQMKNTDLRRRIMEDLNARRKDRAEDIKKTGSTFISLVEAFRDAKIRSAQDKHIELLKVARESKMKEWRKQTTFPDGTKDRILLDDVETTPGGIMERLIEPDLLNNPQPEDIESVQKLKQENKDGTPSTPK